MQVASRREVISIKASFLIKWKKMAKKKGIDVNSVVLVIVIVLVVGLSLGIFYKAPVGEAGEGELGSFRPDSGIIGPSEIETIERESGVVCCSIMTTRYGFGPSRRMYRRISINWADYNECKVGKNKKIINLDTFRQSESQSEYDDYMQITNPENPGGRIRGRIRSITSTQIVDDNLCKRVNENCPHDSCEECYDISGVDYCDSEVCGCKKPDEL